MGRAFDRIFVHSTYLKRNIIFMVLEFDSFDLNQSKMSYFRVRNRYVLLIPQFSIKIININFMRKIDLYCFRRDEVEKMPNALIVLPPQTSFVQFFLSNFTKRPRDKLILPKVKIL